MVTLMEENVLAIALHKGQGLGNQLWAYAATRSISEKIGARFMVLNPNLFKGAGFLDIETGISNDSSQETPRDSWQTFKERLYLDRELDYLGAGYDERLIHLQGRVIVEGHLQSERYFFGDMQKPSRYIKIHKAALQAISVPPDTCIINLRGGEYKRQKRFILPISYWHQAIKNMKALTGVDKFMVVTDDAHYAKVLFPDIPVISGCIATCYAALHQAQHVIVSNSTFSYFPIKTGTSSRTVIAPQYWGRHNSHLNRWASIANLYQSWLWQSRSGELFSYEHCLKEAQETEAYYQANLNVQTTCIPSRGERFRNKFPKQLRQASKTALGWVLPTHFG